MIFINILFVTINTNQIFTQNAPIQEIRILKKVLKQNGLHVNRDKVRFESEETTEDEKILITGSSKDAKFNQVLNNNIINNKIVLVFHAEQNNISILNRNNIKTNNTNDIVIFDTLKLAKKIFDRHFDSYSLKNLCEDLQLNYEEDKNEESLLNLFLLECSYVVKNSQLDNFVNSPMNFLSLTRILKIQKNDIIACKLNDKCKRNRDFEHNNKRLKKGNSNIARMTELNVYGCLDKFLVTKV